jgi:hypothetical protein
VNSAILISFLAHKVCLLYLLPFNFIALKSDIYLAHIMFSSNKLLGTSV